MRRAMDLCDGMIGDPMGRKEELMALKQELQAPRIVVIGTDFSEASADALKEAALLVEGRSTAELHLVHVVLPAPAPSIGMVVAPELTTWNEIDQSATTLES